jgi:aarF domain-containing kinase
MLRRGLRRGVRVVAVGAGVATLGGYAWLTSEFGPETVPRLVRAYRDAIPAFIAYKTVYVFQEQLPAALGRPVDAAAVARAYEALHAVWAPRFLRAALDLKGFYLKSGQMAASNYGNVFPREWQTVFEPLLDQHPAQPFDAVSAYVCAELNVADLSEVFESFEPAPLAAASIGQVHRAVLRGPGPVADRRVAVKVMHPGAEATFRGDVAVMRAFFRAAMPEHAAQFDEVERQFANEFDYRREAAQLARVRGNLLAAAAAPLSSPTGGGSALAFPHVFVPAPLPRLCTKGVLVMEEVVGGVKLTSALKDDFAAIAAARGTSLDGLLLAEQTANEAAEAAGRLRSGPTAASMEQTLAALGWRNALARLWGGAPTWLPLNHAAVIDELLAVHGHEILVDGCFNGDPHPGNLLAVRRPSDGGLERIALVDYGQVKELPPHQRTALARLVVALARADAANPEHRGVIAGLLNAVGFKTAHNTPDALFTLAQIGIDRDDALVTGGRNCLALMQELFAADPTVAMADDFVLVVRASLMLRGLGHMVGQHRSVAAAWAPLAEAVLRAAGEDPDNILPLPPGGPRQAALGSPDP